MELEPLSRCGAADRTCSPADPAPRLLARIRIAVRCFFTRTAPDHRPPCDVEARLLELETHKLHSHHFGSLHR
jgi:hypothetical protein